MQGEIDQLLLLSSAANAMALAVAGSESLGLPSVQAKRLRYTEDLIFADISKQSDGNVKEQIYFNRLSDWLEDLSQRKVSAAWLAWQSQKLTERKANQYTQPEHMNVAFAGATKSWFLITTGPGFTEHWQADWTPQEDRIKQQNIWQVRYKCIQKIDQETPRPVIDLTQETARLGKTLQKISKLASRLGYDNWPAVFDKAIDALEGKTGTALSPTLRPPYYAAYPKEAHRLLAAVYSGWVFGGMGSWNDVVFSIPEDQADYDRLTPELYQSLCRAIVAVSCCFQKR
ncbi:hypothetical protein [Kiloniella sp. EL199]|uniref:hypothetical protein n=1 Tax=Kiloniella sp. EL199 TaxID=2107581 RepID=UPI000EA0CE71|nr:hypothetical protein [Kiloniella sp. EL199]